VFLPSPLLLLLPLMDVLAMAIQCECVTCLGDDCTDSYECCRRLAWAASVVITSALHCAGVTKQALTATQS